MTDNLKPPAPARFYGFSRSREHFIWSKPEEVGATAAQSGLPGQRQAEPGRSDETSIAVLSEAEPSCRVAPPATEIASPCTQAGLPGRRDDRAPEASARGAREIVEPGRSVPADAEAECAASPQVQAVIDLILAQPPLDQQTPEPEPIKKRKRLKKKRQRPKTVIEEPQPPSPAMHEAQCMICNSDYREEMDELFVNWHNVSEIAREYDTPRRTLYRHAHATGLFPIRDRNLRRSLGLIIHRAETVPCLTVDSVIRAVRTLAHINESGEWVNPPSHVIVSSGTLQRTDQVRCPERSRGAEPSSPPEQSRGIAPELLDTPCQAIESVKP